MRYIPIDYFRNICSRRSCFFSRVSRSSFVSSVKALIVHFFTLSSLFSFFFLFPSSRSIPLGLSLFSPFHPTPFLSLSLSLSLFLPLSLVPTIISTTSEVLLSSYCWPTDCARACARSTKCDANFVNGIWRENLVRRGLVLLCSLLCSARRLYSSQASDKA